jgi:hypothetical protein
MPQRLPDSREADSWFSDEQLAEVAPSEIGETLQSPVPTRMVSSGEYMPHPQTDQQKRVEHRIQELAAEASKKLGINRREFLGSSGGMAACFLAMNDVFGHFFDVSRDELFEPEAHGAAAPPKNLFVVDDQLHTTRGLLSLASFKGISNLRAIAQGPTTPGFSANPFNPTGLGDEFGNSWTPWNPALVGLPLTPDAFKVVQFIKDMYFDSQMTVGVLSNAPGSIFTPPGEQPRPPKNIGESLAAEILTAEQTVAVRDFVNGISGSQRLMAHGIFYPGSGNAYYLEHESEMFMPDSWKGYVANNSAKVDNDPNSLMMRWRMDDEAVAYPSYEVVTKYQRKFGKMRPGFGTICVHKGLSTNAEARPQLGHPSDLPKAATDWPNLNFIIYHSCFRPGFWALNALNDIRAGKIREGVPDVLWTTEFAQLTAPHRNVYGEIGTTFASTVITFPTVTAHILGQLMKYKGANNIVFGSDSPWYGSPQWQIEALWRFQIPHEMRRRYGYPELTKEAKRQILGLNSARIYGLRTSDEEDEDGGEQDHEGGLYNPVPADYVARMSAQFKTLLEFPGYTTDNISKMRETYHAMNVPRDNLRHGWVRIGR